MAQVYMKYHHSEQTAIVATLWGLQSYRKGTECRLSKRTRIDGGDNNLWSLNDVAVKEQHEVKSETGLLLAEESNYGINFRTTK
jgi:hypothetical protein